MKQLEDGILKQLAEAEGDVTENIELIENLEDSKGNALLDMILPKKRKGLFAKINLKKVIASNQSPEELQKRLDYLLENITYQVFNFSRRGLFDRHKLILATQLSLKVLSREGKLKESEVAFFLS